MEDYSNCSICGLEFTPETAVAAFSLITNKIGHLKCFKDTYQPSKIIDAEIVEEVEELNKVIEAGQFKVSYCASCNHINEMVKLREEKEELCD